MERYEGAVCPHMDVKRCIERESEKRDRDAQRQREKSY